MLGADRWARRREFNETTFAKDMAEIKARLDRAAEKSSERESATAAKIIDLQLDMREVKTEWLNHRRDCFNYKPRD